MLVGSVVVTFVVLTLLSLPIVFALGLAGFTGLLIGNFSLTKLPSSLVAGSQSWVLLAIPTFVFAGSLMERCGMSYALRDPATARGGGVGGVVRARRSGARDGGLGARWPRPLGGAGRVLLLRHLGLDDRRRLR